MLALLLALSVAPWSQGEICPMKLQSQRAQACGASSPHLHHAAVAKAGEHDCCPHGEAHKAMAHEQCLPVQLTACNSTMTCCSLDPQPSSSPQAVVAPQQPVVLAVRDVGLGLRARRVDVISSLKISFENSVFRLKEDLRI